MWGEDAEGGFGVMATSHQTRYLKNLVRACSRRGIELPNELLEEIDDPDLTLRRASELIDALRMELGLKE
jgi:hypothetical protein